MCVSRLHLVVADASEGRVAARAADGSLCSLSLLAYEGRPPRAGDWVVAHSGYALGPADPGEAASAIALFSEGGSGLGGEAASRAEEEP